MKIICIVGATATGKTALSHWLAGQLLEWGATGVDILSADSKQVYKTMDIVTGKDVPEKCRRWQVRPGLEAFEIKPEINLFGVDVVSPDAEWSVAHFVHYAREVMEFSANNDHDLIIVGGTGMYLHSLFRVPESLDVPRDNVLRQSLDGLSVLELQEQLRSLDATRLARMNNSDAHNPRRLIRAIEVAKWKQANNQGEVASEKNNPTTLWLGLRSDRQSISQRIQTRVQARLYQGALDEVKQLRTAYPQATTEALAAIGYKEIGEYLNGEISDTQMQELWTNREVEYARRQMEWFEHHEPVSWFDIDQPHFQAAIVTKARAWYTS